MYQLIKLYFRLFFKNNKGLLIILILLFTSFSTLYINLHQTKINRDTTTQIYDQYINKYSGIPNNSKEKQILKELDSYENNEDILKEYQEFKSKSKEQLKKENIKLEEDGLIAKMMSTMGISKEVKKDNSDAAIADMLIKGVSMGSIEMEKKIKDFAKEANKEDKKLAEDFLKFQQKTVDKLKEYL